MGTPTYAEVPSPGHHLRLKQQPLGDNANANARTKPRLAIVDFTFSNSYATGGEVLKASDLRFVNVVHIAAPPKGGYLFSVDMTDPTQPKVLAWRCSAAAGAHTQVPNTTDLSGITVRMDVYGTPT